MDLFPVNLIVSGRPATIAGGGAVARRKCLSLLEAGARVTVIAPELDPQLASLRDEGRISHLKRPYTSGDLAGAFLVFAATSDAAVNRAVAEEAATHGILVDVADAPEMGSFTSPAALRRGALLITVSTGGKSPALARAIRGELAAEFGPEYAEVLEILGAAREKLLTTSENTAYNKRILNDLAASPLAEMVSAQRYDEIDRLLTRHAGPGFTLDGLGLGKKDSP